MKSVSSPSVATHNFTLRLTYPNQIGMFARIADTIGRHGGDLGAISIETPGAGLMTRGLNVRATSPDHAERILQALKQIEEVKRVEISDPVFQMHHHGKIVVQSKVPLKTREELSMAYTPGVARVSSAIAKDKSKVWTLTAKANAVAVVSDGTAVLGLGDIGPEGAMPVMEGKAMLFKQFGNVDAYPICLRTKNPEEIIQTVVNLSVGFGGINLEDISAPRCFEIETKLQELLDIPVFHDDQHGTAIVVLAGVYNALRLTGQKLGQLRIVLCGAGAAGMSITKMLLKSGARDVMACDRQGIIHPKRTDLNDSKVWLAQNTNPRRISGSLEDAMKGAHIFIGVSGPGLVTPRMVKSMAPKPIVFALANPTPEIMPEEANAFIMATGRSDYPNQINNVLAFPGIFRGALDVQASRITESMKLAAAKAIASCVSAKELARDFIIPSVFNPVVGQKVAAAVQQAALKAGVARKAPPQAPVA
ncbi:MAG TPA: NAD-dependent malic enzyme [Candidatus Sulfotelmatobacter sp.]|nr:NAD-dependent malic enzyme [Candidatus Sulfotelmatobacter sp.]